jgi:hypothetical protein
MLYGRFRLPHNEEKNITCYEVETRMFILSGNGSHEGRRSYCNKELEMVVKSLYKRGCHGRDRMVVRFTTKCTCTYAVSAYHH